MIRSSFKFFFALGALVSAAVAIAVPSALAVGDVKPPGDSQRGVAKPVTFPDLIAKVRSGVIRIEVEGCSGGAVGTGFLIGPRLVATVEHVVDGAGRIVLKRNGKVLGTGTVIGEDAVRDVALVRTSTPITGHRFMLESRSPRLGEDVAALGFPLGLPLTVTRGSVSGLDRTIPIGDTNRQRLVQTDASVNPGNSGGPLLTDSGDVVGLVDLGTNDANGLSFAVSAQVAAPLLQAWTLAPQPVSAATCDPTSGGEPPAAPAPPPAG